MQRLSIQVPKPRSASVLLKKAMETPLPQKTPLGTVGALHLAGLEGGTLAVVIKKTYDIFPNALPRASAEQVPIDAEGQLHDPISDLVEPSWKCLPEMLGYKTGTDVILQGYARSPRPVTELRVGLRLGNYTHEALAIGRRKVEVVQGRLIFTPPKPFEALPLRHELAYGGCDVHYEEAYLKELKKQMSREQFRKAAAALEAIWGGNNYVLRYPRNRFGVGYAVTPDPKWHLGRVLPHLERLDDRLTPERFICRNPSKWQQQPLPIGFDYLDPYSFPLNAMMGLPPAGFDPNGPQPELKRNLIPADYYKGNATQVKGEEVVKVLHPMVGRQASLGLWFGHLRGSETFEVFGVDPNYPQYNVILPNEFPIPQPLGALRLPDPKAMQLTKIHLDTEKRKLIQVWAVRYSMPTAPSPEVLEELPSQLQIHYKRFS